VLRGGLIPAKQTPADFPQGMVDLIKKDADKAIDDLF